MRVLILEGDGIGPEVSRVAVDVLQTVVSDVEIEYELIGGSAIDEHGHPVSDDVLDMAREFGVVFLGAVGGPKWDEMAHRPEAGLLRLRREMGVNINVRPVQVMPELVECSPVKKDVAEKIDFVIVRELTGGLYYGDRYRSKDEARDVMVYGRDEIESVVRYGYELAEKRCGRLTSVDKANVLECSRLWREVADEVGLEFEGVEVEHVYVDAAAMMMVADPGRFDVVVTENMFGDILSDLGGGLVGSLGLMPSASVNSGGVMWLFEPVHGSAPAIAGEDKANPVAAILSMAMLVEMAFGCRAEGDAIRRAVREVIGLGVRTVDMGARGRVVGTAEFGGLVMDSIRQDACKGR